MSLISKQDALLRYLALIKERPEEFDNSDAEYKIINSPEQIKNFEERTGLTIGVVYESQYNIMLVDLVSDGENLFSYERIIPAVKNSAVVALTICSGKFIMLRQYRHALRDWQYAFPRGFGEHILTAYENMLKELSEELGCDTISSLYLGNIAPDSGLTGNIAKVYLCNINNYQQRRHYEGIKQVDEFTPDELKQLIRNGKINDGFSLAALSLYRAI